MQAVQLGIFDAFHNVCKDKGLCYYMVGGTLLGAVRHKGFIPWDADIDIAMPRKDYDLFIAKYHSCLPPKYMLITHESYKYFSKPHAVIIQSGTSLKYHTDSSYNHQECPGIYIELFPLDNVPTDHRKRLKQERKVKQIRKLIFRKVSRIYTTSLIEILIKKSIRLLLEPLSLKKLGRALQNAMRKYDTMEDYSGVLCSMAGKHGYEKESLPVEMYGSPVLLEFEGKQYYAPTEYFKFLEHYYGDYMKLPSIEEQEKMYNYFSEIEVSGG